VFQHQASNPRILENKNSKGGLAHIPLGTTRELTGGLRGTPRRSHPPNDTTGSTSAPPPRPHSTQRNSRGPRRKGLAEGNCDTAGHRRYGHHRPARLGACHPTAVSRYIYLRGQIPRTGMAGYPLRARSHPACGSKGTVATKS